MYLSTYPELRIWASRWIVIRRQVLCGNLVDVAFELHIGAMFTNIRNFRHNTATELMLHPQRPGIQVGQRRVIRIKNSVRFWPLYAVGEVEAFTYGSGVVVP